MKSGGRTKGVPNRITAHLRSVISDHLEQYLEERFLTDWKDISPRERVRMASNLIKLIVPQPNRETIEEPTDIPPDEIKVTIVTAKEEIDRLKELRQ